MTIPNTPYLLVAIPTYQVSVDESHPEALGNFTGCSLFPGGPGLSWPKNTPRTFAPVRPVMPG